MERRETSLLSNAALLAAIHVDVRYQGLLKYSQKTVAQADLVILWRRLQIGECVVSSSESEDGFTSAWEVDITDEILATSDANANDLELRMPAHHNDHGMNKM